MKTHMELYPEQDLFANKNRIGMFNKVMGTDRIMQMLKDGIPVEQIEQSWQPELNAFLKTRAKYLIYQ
jgi:uncharacterized protein YbbC (DUF1343 family)